MKKNKLLIIVATHGDETFSIPVVKKLAMSYGFDWLVGNPQAVKAGTRQTQADLNRSAPGDIKSQVYEKRRAYRLIKLAKKYEAVLDIHGTTYLKGIVTIVTNPSWENIELAKTIPTKTTIIWPSLRTQDCPITQFMPRAIEVECGKDNQLENLLTQYLNQPQKTYSQNQYIVTGKILGRSNPNLRDFEYTKLNNRYFYPFLSNLYSGITCYMTQKIGEKLSLLEMPKELTKGKILPVLI